MLTTRCVDLESTWELSISTQMLLTGDDQSFNTHLTSKIFVIVGATTAEAWTTMPKSASYHPSQRSAISARALTTWLPTAQSKHNSPRQDLRENRPPWKETRRSTATRHRLPRPPTKLGNTDTGEAQRPIKLLWRWDGTHTTLFHLMKLLLELPQV